MSSEALTWAKKTSTGRVADKSVLIALADYADHEGYCYPSMKTLAQATDMTDRHVRRCMARLEAAGLVQREERARQNGAQTSNGYRLQLRTADMVAPGPEEDTPRTHRSAPPLTNGTNPPDSQVRPPRTHESAPPGHSGPPIRTPLEPKTSEEVFAPARAADGSVDEAGSVGLARTLCRVPSELRDQLSADPRFGEGWVVSWLDPCGFDPEARQLHARSIFARGRLAQDIARELRSHKIGLGEPVAVRR
jgi:hypothetical protein